MLEQPEIMKLSYSPCKKYFPCKFSVVFLFLDPKKKGMLWIWIILMYAAVLKLFTNKHKKKIDSYLNFVQVIKADQTFPYKQFDKLIFRRHKSQRILGSQLPWNCLVRPGKRPSPPDSECSGKLFKWYQIKHRRCLTMWEQQTIAFFWQKF